MTLEELKEAFKDSAFAPEIVEGRYWIAYGVSKATVVPVVSLPKSPLDHKAWQVATVYQANDPQNPNNTPIQEMCDLLEKHTGEPCNSFEMLVGWFGRMTTHWLGFKDVTDWHESSKSKEALYKELHEAYAP